MFKTDTRIVDYVMNITAILMRFGHASCWCFNRFRRCVSVQSVVGCKYAAKAARRDCWSSVFQWPSASVQWDCWYVSAYC